MPTFYLFCAKTEVSYVKVLWKNKCLVYDNDESSYAHGKVAVQSKSVIGGMKCPLDTGRHNDGLANNLNEIIIITICTKWGLFKEINNDNNKY